VCVCVCVFRVVQYETRAPICDTNLSAIED
jgi:hypothetical protein